MKVVNLTFSLTGNTLVVANRIERALIRSGHEVIHFDGFSLVKQLNLKTRTPAVPDSTPRDYSELLNPLKNALESADIIGIGSYVYCFNPPPGVYELLFDGGLPNSAFTHAQYCFTYTTHGSLPNKARNSLFYYLHAKNPSIQLIDSLDIRCPENIAFLMPRMPNPDAWAESELKRVDTFAAAFVDALSCDPVRIIAQPRISAPDIITERKRMQNIKGKIVIDPDLCVRCGTCISLCPYNALEMTEVQPVETKQPTENSDSTSSTVKSDQLPQSTPAPEPSTSSDPATLPEASQQSEHESSSQPEQSAQNQPDTPSSSSVTEPDQKPKQSYTRIVVNLEDKCQSCCRCYNWCPKKAIAVLPASSKPRVQYKAVSLRDMQHPPFSASTSLEGDPEDLPAPLEPPIGNLPSIARVLFRAVF